MNAKRTFYVMIAVVLILIVAIFGSVYGIRQLLSQQSVKLLQNKAKLTALSTEQVQLTQAKKDIKESTDLYNISKTIVPQTKDQTQAVRQIVSLAATNGVTLQSITFPASTLGNAPAGVSTPTSNLGLSSPSANTNKLSQLTPVKNIPGVYTLILTVNSDPTHYVTYPQLIGFLSSLENNRQTALVNTVSISPNPQNHSEFSFILTLAIYIKP